MACTFTFDLPVDPLALLPIVRKEIEQNGGVVTGEIPNLSVQVPTVAGELRGNCALIKPMVVKIEITKKPEIVSCNMAREKLVEYLTEAVKTYVHQTKAAQQKT